MKVLCAGMVKHLQTVGESLTGHTRPLLSLVAFGRLEIAGCNTTTQLQEEEEKKRLPASTRDFMKHYKKWFLLPPLEDKFGLSSPLPSTMTP